MSNATQTVLGSVVSLWRYPVKSMMGEELNASEVTPGGLLGDRAYALVDGVDGKIASAKNPRKWPGGRIRRGDPVRLEELRLTKKYLVLESGRLVKRSPILVTGSPRFRI